MALYEYVCESCNTATERRMPMSDVLAHIECPACGKTAKKALASFAVVGVAEPGFGDDEAPPWDAGGAGGGHGHSHDDFGGMDDDFDF